MRQPSEAGQEAALDQDRQQDVHGDVHRDVHQDVHQDIPQDVHPDIPQDLPQELLVDSDSLIGFRVETSDGHTGKVNHHTAGVGPGYLIVDTGVWVFGDLVKLPLSAVARVDRTEQKVWLTLSKRQIDEEYRRQTDAYYHLDQLDQ